VVWEEGKALLSGLHIMGGEQGLTLEQGPDFGMLNCMVKMIEGWELVD